MNTQTKETQSKLTNLTEVKHSGYDCIATVATKMIKIHFSTNKKDKSHQKFTQQKKQFGLKQFFPKYMLTK